MRKTATVPDLAEGALLNEGYNMNTINALEIIDTIRSFGAETDEAIILTLEDGEALAYMGITDADQEAVEEAHALLRAEVDGSVTVGTFTIAANKTSRSRKAVSAIAKAQASIEALGFVIDTKGPSAGHAGSFPVYVYPAAAMHQVGDKNRAADAAYVFNVQYMKGRWFASSSAVAESMAYGLKEALNALGASLVAA